MGDLIVRIVIVVIAIVVLCALALSSSISSKPDASPTPAPDTTAAQVLGGLEPIIVEIARSIDAGTTASLADTKTAHPEPPPSLSEIWAWPLALICSVCILTGFPSLAFVVWRLAVNNERVAARAVVVSGDSTIENATEN